MRNMFPDKRTASYFKEISIYVAQKRIPPTAVVIEKICGFNALKQVSALFLISLCVSYS